MDADRGATHCGRLPAFSRTSDIVTYLKCGRHEVGSVFLYTNHDKTNRQLADQSGFHTPTGIACILTLAAENKWIDDGGSHQQRDGNRQPSWPELRQLSEPVAERIPSQLEIPP